ncbi:hypothetical protein MMC17_000183 [Xylographa soralifera]|nr:hypothetical protein [Xylographa soralifera]
MAPSIDLDYLTSLYIDPGKQLPVAKTQCLHRIHIIQDIWAIPAGSKVLEIGPGQGDCTLVLAAAVGEQGHVDAVDPCDLNYGRHSYASSGRNPSTPLTPPSGSPWTVGQAQAHIAGGPLGLRISFIQADPLAYLASTSAVYDYVVLFHCLWYFDSPARIAALFAALAPKAHAANILIAEWALEAELLAQVPHVLAALARANLEVHNPASKANIRTAASPAWIKGCFEGLGVRVRREEMVLPPDGLRDGVWEVGSVVAEEFGQDVARYCGDGGQAAAVLGIREAVVAAVKGLQAGVDGVRSMQVWVAEFYR